MLFLCCVSALLFLMFFCFHVFDVHYLFLHTVQFVHSCIYKFHLLILSSIHLPFLLCIIFMILLCICYIHCTCLKCIDVFSFVLSSQFPTPPLFSVVLQCVYYYCCFFPAYNFLPSPLVSL